MKKLYTLALLCLCICPSLLRAQISGVTITPARATPADTITITVDPALVCPAGTPGLVGAQIMRIHSGVTLNGNAWQSIVGAGLGADSARVAFSRLPNGLWQKKIKPSDYYGQRADTIQQLCFVLNGGPAANPWAREGKRQDAVTNCADFIISFPIQGQIAGQPALSINVTPAGPVVLCNGDSTVLTASTSTRARVQWRKDGLALPGDTFRTLTVSQFGNYSAIATSADSLGQSNDVSVVVRPPVTPPSAIATFTCAGNAATLTARGAQGNATYEWYDSDTSQTLLASGATFTTPPLLDTTVYFALIRQDGCPSQRQGVVVEVAPAPDTPRFSGTTLLCAPGGAFSLQVLTLPPDPVVRWYADSLRQSLIDSGLVFQRTVGQTTRYWAQARLGFCQSALVPVTITVAPLPALPLIRQQGNSLIAPRGYIQYTWSYNNQPLPAATDTLVPQNEGFYTVSITDTNGCRATSAAFNFIRVGLVKQNASTIVAYPNPSQAGFFTVRGISDSDHLEVYNAQGKCLYRARGTAELDLTAYPKGTYLVRIHRVGQPQHLRLTTL